MTGATFGTVRRHGKFLIYAFEDGQVLVVQAMLSGRYQWTTVGAKKKGRTVLILDLDDGHSLRYHDQRVMGRIICRISSTSSKCRTWRRWVPTC